MDLIESAKNPKFRLWYSLLEGRNIKKQQKFLLMGRKLIPEFWNQCPELFSTALVTPKNIELLPQNCDVPQFQLSTDLFEKIDIFNTRFPILVGNLPQWLNWDEEGDLKGLEVLTALGDPANQGALIRSAEAFGAHTCVLLKESVHPFHPKSIRASSGSVLRMKFLIGPSISELKGTLTVALNMHGKSLDQYSWNRNARLLVGEEGLGLPNPLKAQAIQIPMAGSHIESLNAVAATSIALYSYQQSFK